MKQERFVQEYLGNAKCNATLAAINAGYSEKTAQEQSSRLLTNEAVQFAINERQNVLREKASITQERIVEEYARIAFLDPRKFFDDNGKLIDIAHLDEDTARALGGLGYQIKYSTSVPTGACTSSMSAPASSIVMPEAPRINSAMIHAAP